MSIQDLRFRQAQIGDIAILRELEQRVVEAERPFNSEIKEGRPIYYDLEQLISGNNSCLLVAESINEIVGCGYVQIRQSRPSLNHLQHAYLGFLYLDPDHRGMGIIQSLMSELIDWSKAYEISHVYLDVYSQNKKAIRAYEKAGFEHCTIEMKLKL